jgi:CRISPR-associated protein Csx17
LSTCCRAALRSLPLAGYLKALGVFRLVAEQADTEARGFWRDERFVLRTRLSEHDLIQFFVDSYRPTPVVTRAVQFSLRQRV